MHISALTSVIARSNLAHASVFSMPRGTCLRHEGLLLMPTIDMSCSSQTSSLPEYHVGLKLQVVQCVLSAYNAFGTLHTLLYKTPHNILCWCNYNSLESYWTCLPKYEWPIKTKFKGKNLVVNVWIFWKIVVNGDELREEGTTLEVSSNSGKTQ